jgi:hypothetical protein
LCLTETPTYFNTELLPPLSVHQIVFFDECHKKTEIGRTGDTVYTFPKNEAGLYDKDGQIGDVDTKMHCKYTKEGRFYVGVSVVELSDGTIEGRRCETFDYSGKLYKHDSVMEMGNIAEKTTNKLEMHGIITVLDIKMLTQRKLNHLHY